MRYGVCLAVLLLAGCASNQMPVLDQETAPAVSSISCEGRAASQCKFINSPVKLSSKPIRLPDSPFPFYKTRNDLEFVDATGQTWIAPAGILTDGASIPPLFVPLIGNPRSKQFMNAATVHDSYCAESNRGGPYYHTAPWQKVHRMFYDGLRASGTSPIKAKIMYAAVYLGGPRWKGVRQPGARRRAQEMSPSPRIRTASAMPETALTITPVAAPAQSDVPLTRLYSKARLISAFKQARAYIKAANPGIGALDTYLMQREHDLASASAHPQRPGTNFRAAPYEYDPSTEGGEGRNDHDSGGGSSGHTGNTGSESNSRSNDSGGYGSPGLQ